LADNKDDYKIKVRLDLSGIESDSKKIADKIKRGAGASTANLDGEVKKKKESLKLTEKQTLALEKQQRSLERSIKRAKRQGVGGLGGIELAASSGDAIKMGRAQSQLATKVLDQHHKTLDVKNQSLNVSKEQQTLDAENYRIWQLRQQGDARRAKEAERERAAAIRQAKSVQSSAPTGTRILAGAGQLQTDAKFKARDLNNLIDSETHPSLAGRRDSVRGTLESIGSRAKGATDPDQIRELRKEYQAASRDLADLVREQKALNKELNRTNPIASKFGATFKSALLGIASAYALLEVAKAVYKIGSEMDAMRASLLAASGSAEEAGKNFEFIKATAKDLGKDLQTMTGGFNRLGVAMKAQGFTSEETKAAFLSVAESATAFSLDSERTGNIILAMSQMVS
jgi:hypothetical protein